ncbi:MAG: hypothetical protein JSS04_11345 [Proteobacteria bacterium]|nr:hypothetical protein [Pseudomonadota bacterium]
MVNLSYKLAWGLAIVAVLSSALIIANYFIVRSTLPPAWLHEFWVLPVRTSAQAAIILVATLALIVSAIGAVSTMFWGWRIDRRRAKKFESKIAHLELQVAELKQQRS